MTTVQTVEFNIQRFDLLAEIRYELTIRFDLGIRCSGDRLASNWWTGILDGPQNDRAAAARAFGDK